MTDRYKPAHSLPPSADVNTNANPIQLQLLPTVSTLQATVQDPAALDLVWCANARLALELHNETLRSAPPSNRPIPALPCLTFAHWIGRMREELLLLGWGAAEGLAVPTLNAVEERLVWEQVVAEDLQHRHEGLGDFFDHVGLAQKAQEAHALSVVWGVAVPSSPEGVSAEAWQFAQWRKLFQQRCQALGRLDAAQCQANVVKAWLSQPQGVPRRLGLAGYVRLDPQETVVLNRLRELGCEIVRLGAQQAPAQPQPQLNWRSYPDAAAERLAAALWAQARLEADPQERIAIVVPDLGSQRDAWTDVLDDLLAPHTARCEAADDARPYNLSLGTPLTRSPLVALALHLLSLVGHAHKAALADWGALLRHPMWSVSAERAERALLDADLRRQQSPHAPLAHWLAVSLSRLVDEAPGQTAQRGTTGEADQGPTQSALRTWPAPHTAAHLRALQSGLRWAKLKQMPSQWAAGLLPWLRQVGWLAGHTLDSGLYQTERAFQAVVQSTNALDSVMGPVPLSRYAQELRRQCQDRVFQPETEQAPRLQVLGLLEAAGLHFDAVWAVGLTDQAWPPAARPHPLLSVASQREVRAPNASAAVQQQFALAVQEALQSCAPELVLSWPRMDGESMLRPSAWLSDVQQAQAETAPATTVWWQTAHANSVPAEQGLAAPELDHKAPPVPEGGNVKGGTWLLRAQAICPAWAYFQYRLGAGKLETPIEGPDPRQRGLLLHSALEHFWKLTRSSAALQALGEEDCLERVAHCVDLALAPTEPGRQALREQFKALERQRLCRLLMAWLDLERERPPFEVLSCEEVTSLTVRGLSMRMSVDRVDRLLAPTDEVAADLGQSAAEADPLNTEAVMIIDYKTGQAIDMRSWGQDRLTTPQLPIYASLATPKHQTVVAVAFAKLPHVNDLSFKGLGSSPMPKPLHGVKALAKARKQFPEAQFTSWAELMRHWRQRIEAVADEVKAGVAAVTLSREQDLAHCDVLALLRLPERQQQWEATQARDETPDAGDAA